MFYFVLIMIMLGSQFHYAIKRSNTLIDKNTKRYQLEMEQEATEQNNAQLRKWAAEVKDQVSFLNNYCTNSTTTVEPLVSTAYIAEPQMKNILKELARVAELQGMVDSISDELSIERDPK